MAVNCRPVSYRTSWWQSDLCMVWFRWRANIESSLRRRADRPDNSIPEVSYQSSCRCWYIGRGDYNTWDGA